MNPRLAIMAAAILVSGGIAAVEGQEPVMTADEKAIRELIAATDSGKPAELSANMVLFNDRLEAPFYRGQGQTARFKATAPETVPLSSSRTSTIRRLDISKSGDMAHVVDEGVDTFQLKDGKTESRTSAALRVFRKENGRWRVAAVFLFPSSPETKK